MSSILTDLTSIFTAVVGYVGDVAEVIVDTPILELSVLVSLVGIGVGMFKRLLSVN